MTLAAAYVAGLFAGIIVTLVALVCRKEWRRRPRCGRNEVDARENGCARGPCPMAYRG